MLAIAFRYQSAKVGSDKIRLLKKSEHSIIWDIISCTLFIMMLTINYTNIRVMWRGKMFNILRKDSMLNLCIVLVPTSFSRDLDLHC